MALLDRFQWTPLTRRRLANFRANRRGYWCLWIFPLLLLLTLPADSAQPGMSRQYDA